MRINNLVLGLTLAIGNNSLVLVNQFLAISYITFDGLFGNSTYLIFNVILLAMLQTLVQLIKLLHKLVLLKRIATLYTHSHKQQPTRIRRN